MAAGLAIPLFVASLAVTLTAARYFAQRLDSIGTRFGLPEAMIGLLTAVAADGPEISSAMVALIKGAHSTSVGVLVGSWQTIDGLCRASPCRQATAFRCRSTTWDTLQVRHTLPMPRQSPRRHKDLPSQMGRPREPALLSGRSPHRPAMF